MVLLTEGTGLAQVQEDFATSEQWTEILDRLSDGTAGVFDEYPMAISWEEFLLSYNAFCSERGGTPLFNQTPFLNREMARRAFGPRLQQFAARRQELDPDGRLLDQHFRELLS